MADLDLDLIIQSRLDFDPVGHYTRQDLFDFRRKTVDNMEQQES